MPNRTLKGLFITHDVTHYGASRSLQLLLRNYQDAQIDLVVKKNLVAPDAGFDDIRTRFGPNVRKIWRIFLPFDYCFSYKPGPSFKWFVVKILHRLTWKLHKRTLYGILKEGQYDFIHLNSLVLHPVIRRDFPFIIHIRDIYDGSNPNAIRNIRNAAGVIFIDESTKAPFKDTPFDRSIVLNNPFDMTPLSSYRDRDMAWPEENFRDRVIFSIIGTVTDKKGVDFILRCFLNVTNKNARLLIVGKGEPRYIAFCKKLAHHDPRVIFWGEEQDIMKIYAVSDYILRGEAYQCIGRTIYEGLYAGCSVIVPALQPDLHHMFEYETFRDSIHAYKPRDQEDLTSVLNTLSSTKINNRVYRSNVPEYIRQFQRFIREIVEAGHQAGYSDSR